jgi:hypothetical protein
MAMRNHEMEMKANSVNFARRGFAARRKLPRFWFAAARKIGEFCTRIFCESYSVQPVGSRKHGQVPTSLHSGEQNAFAKFKKRMRIQQTSTRMKKAHSVMPGLLEINSFEAVGLIRVGAARQEPRANRLRLTARQEPRPPHPPTYSRPHRLTLPPPTRLP